MDKRRSGPPRRPSGPKKPFNRAGGPARSGQPARPQADRKPSAPGQAAPGAKPARPFGDRPARPHGDKPARPFGDRPARPHGDKPARPFGDKPARPATDKPARPAGDKPRAPKPANPRGGASPLDARRLALYALSDVARAGAYSTLALDEHLRRATRVSVEDKRLATSIFYAALENRLRIEWTLKKFVEKKPEAVVEDILHIAAAQLLFMDKLPDHAVVDEAVKQVKALRLEHAVPFVNGTLRTLIRARDAGEIVLPDREADPIAHLSVAHSLPEMLARRLIDDYGFAEAEAMIAYRPDERLETIRPNLTRYDDASFAEYLASRGWPVTPGVVPHAFLLKGAGDLGSDPGYRDGLFTVQGQGSMLAALAVKPKRGENILDACAAPGGKSALMSELMGATGRVHAWELHEHRAELIRALKKRLKLDNLRVAVRDAAIPREDCEGAYDAVLIDAPCSGLGVMVNKPDIKYRVSEDGIASLVALQRSILDACAAYPRVGGRLVYSTCTVLRDENERQIESFLARHPNYAPDPSVDWLPEALRDGYTDGMIQLKAHRDGMEGFFIARLIRKA